MPWKIAPRLLQAEPMRRCELDECRAACCLYGVWVDLQEAEKILSHASLISPHLPEERRDPQTWFDGRQEADSHTPSGQVVHSRVMSIPVHYGGSACIFLRADFKCALQVGGEAAGFHPWHFKPFYCILHPLDLDDEGCITLDESELLLAEPASCLRPAGQAAPLLVTFEPELRYLLGEEAYQALLRQASGKAHS